MRSMCRTLIILVGPQGVGKTTLARTLYWSYVSSKKCPVAMITADIANIVYTIYLRIISYYKGIYVRFYPDQPRVLRPDPKVLPKLWIVEFLVSLFGHILALLKVMFLLLFYDIVIEHEGFTFKFIANFAYDQYMYTRMITKSRSTNGITRALTRILIITIYSLIGLSKLTKSRIYVINVHSTYNKLVSRYRFRGTPIEPRHYIEFQLSIYNLIEKCLRSLTMTINVVRVCT